MLTPLDIENKKFQKQMMNGYNVDEVDDFLDEITVDYEKLYKENTELRAEIERSKGDLEKYKNIEQTLQNTLVMAQKTADDIKNNAQDEEEDRGIFKRKNRVVNIAQQQIKMKIAKPTAFEQAEDICILLREKNAIVVNLEYVNKDVARRILDVISGAVKVLDGHFEKVSNSIFIVAPFNYDIVNDMTREEIKNKLSVSWLNK